MTTRFVSANTLVIRILPWVLACGLLACRGPQQPSLPALDQAEALMHERPDSALTILQGIDATMLPDRALQAQYALLYTQALYKNDLPLSEDSLINIAVQHYKKGSNTRYKASAYLYQGVVYKQMDSIARAFSSYMSAAETVDQEQDAHIYGLTQAYLSTLYHEQGQYKQALDLYKNALAAFRRAGYQSNINYALGQLGDLFYRSNMADSAAHYYLSAKQLAAERRDSNYMYDMDISMVTLMQDLKEYAKAKTLLLEVINQYKGGIIPEDCYSDLGFSYFGLRQLDSARHYMQLALQNSTPATERYVWMLSVMQGIARLEANPTEALDFQTQYMHANDSIQRVRDNQNIRIIEANYHREKAELENDKYTRRNYILFPSILLVILLLSVAILLWQRKQEQKRMVLREQEIQAVTEKKYAPVKDMLHQSIYKQWDVSLFLDQCPKIRTVEDEKALHIMVIQTANSHYPGFTLWLKTHFPKLRTSEISLACLLFCGLSMQDLNAVYRLDQGTLYTRRSRLYGKLGIRMPRGRESSFRDVLIRTYQQKQESQ